MRRSPGRGARRGRRGVGSQVVAGSLCCFSSSIRPPQRRGRQCPGSPGRVACEPLSPRWSPFAATADTERGDPPHCGNLSPCASALSRQDQTSSGHLRRRCQKIGPSRRRGATLSPWWWGEFSSLEHRERSDPTPQHFLHASAAVTERDRGLAKRHRGRVTVKQAASGASPRRG